VTPLVITRVRNRPGVARGPVRFSRRSKIRLTWSGAPGVEVVADDLLEEDPSRDRLVKHLGQGELCLQDGQVIAVTGLPVGGGERVWQPGQPFAQQRVDLPWSQPVTDPLQGSRVADRGEAVVQCLEPDAGPGGLPLGPVVAVDAQLGVVGEVGAELQEERAEVAVHTVEVEVVDHPGGLDDPRVGLALAVVALLGPEQRGFLLRSPDEHDPLGAASRLEGGQILVHHIVFALPPGKVHPGDLLPRGETVHRSGEPIGDPGQRGGRGDRQAQLTLHIPQQPARVLQLRDVDIEIHPVDALHLERHMLG
jgi:hypothetical protein